MFTRLWLVCGILASAAYLIADVGGGLRWPGYSFLDYSISEIAALDTPSRPFAVKVFALHGVLLAAFVAGVLRGPYPRAAKHAAAFLGLIAVIGAIAAFFPIRQRGVALSRNEEIHMLLTLASVLCIVAAMITGGQSSGRGFRRFSKATIVMTLFFGAMAGSYAPQLSAGTPTPWLGVVERLSVYSYLLWIAAFANMLLSGDREH